MKLASSRIRKPTKICVVFGEHMKPDRFDSMLSVLKAAGDMTYGPDERTFFVEVRREQSLANLKRTLLGWDRWGFVKWFEVTDDPEVS